MNSVVIPANINLLSNTNDNVYYKLLLNPTITGGTWVSAGTDSFVEYNLGGTLSGGTGIQSGYCLAKSSTRVSNLDDFRYQLGRTLAGVSDIITLVATPFSINAAIAGELDWYEL